MFRLLLFLSSFVVLPAALRADTDGKFNPEEFAQARIETLEAVKGLVPVPAGAPPVETTGTHGPYMLHGRLFGGSTQWALVDLTRGVAAAKWVKGKWAFSDAWQIPVLWTGSRTEDDTRSLVNKLPVKPFWLRTLWKDAPPFLVVPTDFDRYHFDHKILRFDPEAGKIRAPKWLSISEPQARGDYLCLTGLSPRKSWWHQTDYYQRSGNTFTFTASWKDDVTDPEARVLTVERPDKKAGKTITFNVTESNSGYQIREGDRTVGSIDFLPNKSGMEGESFSEAEELWLFEALTGLPASAYGDKINGKETVKVRAAMKWLRPVVKGDGLRRLIDHGKTTGMPAKTKD